MRPPSLPGSRRPLPRNHCAERGDHPVVLTSTTNTAREGRRGLSRMVLAIVVGFALLGALYAALLAALWFGQERLLFFPQALPATHRFAVEADQVFFILFTQYFSVKNSRLRVMIVFTFCISIIPVCNISI